VGKVEVVVEYALTHKGLEERSGEEFDVVAGSVQGHQASGLTEDSQVLDQLSEDCSVVEGLLSLDGGEDSIELGLRSDVVSKLELGFAIDDIVERSTLSEILDGLSPHSWRFPQGGEQPCDNLRRQ
jgi:hypothetical protein